MKLKDNKGVIGSDVSIAIILIVLFVGILTTVFYQIGMSNAAAKRQATATNYAVSILEQIALMPYDGEDGLKSKTNEELTKMGQGYVTKGYEVSVQKLSMDKEKEDLMQEVSVKITYPLGNTKKEIEIKTLKTHK